LLVENSLTNRRWVVNDHDERLATALTQRFALPDIVGQVMAARGISLDGAADFLEPTLRSLLPDPFHLKDMEKACVRMAAALKSGEKIAVYGDYDVDGATSSALLIRYARAIGASITPYIPDRIIEGYGPNAAAMKKLAEDGYKLIITVDCGITAHEPLRVAQEAGADVIVLDHHVAEPELPLACAVINPNRLDETSPHRHLAAVGVTFLFLVALHKTLRAEGFFTGKTEPDLLSELDLVALGTVCDMVALTGVNRAIVRQGLKVMGQSKNTGLLALLAVSGSSGPADTYTAGFLLGPRVNAGGRVGKSNLGTRLLSSESESETAELAQQLNHLNDERKLIEQAALDEALSMVPHEKAAAVMVASDSWHPGVIGLIASRLKERYGRPAFVTSFDGDIGKGSCRSVKGIDIGTLVIAARQEGLLINGGGHAMAAGYTVSRGNFEAFKNFAETRIKTALEESPLVPTLIIDGLLGVGGVTIELSEKLQSLAPFGMGNPEPRFAVMEAILVRADRVGQNHLRLNLKDDSGHFIKAMAWRVLDNPMGEAILQAPKGSRLHVAGHIRLNSWAMRSEAQLIVDDVALA
jgi:single-stranded-DNA-specific exonuclease